MKYHTRFLALVLAALMLFGLLAACTSEPAENPSAGTATPAASSGSSASDSAGESQSASLPLVSEPTTFTCWIPFSNQYVATLNDVTAVQEAERLTGIHIEFSHPAEGTESETFNLLIAGQQLPDFFQDYGHTGGAQKAIDDEFYLELSPYLDAYMPNYSAIRNADIQVRRDTTTDQGSVAGIYGLWDTPEPPWAGLMIRKDWTDDLGLALPTTYDEWHTMLTAFKDQKGATSALLLDSSSNFMFGELSAGYGVNMAFYMKDGVIHYSPLEDGYKKYLSTVSQWYQEGLIDGDYYSNSIWATAYSKGMTGEAGVIWGIPELSGDNNVKNGYSPDQNMFYQAVVSPKETASTEIHFRCNPIRARSPFAVSAQCSNPELLLRWLDFGYSEQGSMLYSFGIEGDTLEYVDGKPQYTDKVIYDPEISFTDNRWRYCVNTYPFLGYAYRFTRVTQGDSFADQLVYTLASQQVWLTQDCDYILPSTISMTTEEGTEYSSIYNDIETLVREATLRIITGTDSIESWDGVVSRIQSMNIERAIAIQQAALDRYNAR